MTLDHLEEELSRPNESDRALMRRLKGDILILGAGGKMGPSMARLARRAADEAGSSCEIFAASRFSSEDAERQLRDCGVRTIRCDLLDRAQLARLPDCPNVIFLAGRKFGSADNQPLTWATNVLLPGFVGERFRGFRIVALSSGNVYPLSARPVAETTPPSPIGEYAQSVLGRERVFEYYSVRDDTPMVFIRLNYAVELRYGVLLDLGQRVWERQPVPLAMGSVNVIWQSDANSICLRALECAATPPLVLNVTGPEVLRIRSIAERFGQIFGVAPVLEGEESETALLSDASLCWSLMGAPTMSPEPMIVRIADWIRAGSPTLNKPTHFEVRNGQF